MAQNGFRGNNNNNRRSTNGNNGMMFPNILGGFDPMRIFSSGMFGNNMPMSGMSAGPMGGANGMTGNGMFDMMSMFMNMQNNRTQAPRQAQTQTQMNSNRGNTVKAQTVAPTFAMDVVDQGDRYEVTAVLPGYDKNEIVVEINADVLTISAEHNLEVVIEEVKYIQKERKYDTVSRSIELQEMDKEEVQAEYINGVLEVSIPKITEEKKAAKTIIVR